MAKKKKNERVILEDIELRPQVIGYTFQKKNNIGRVILIFIAFILAVYYINDISVFINDLLGKNTASSIVEGTNNKDNFKEEVPQANPVNYHIFSNTLEINQDNLVLNNFSYNNNTLLFNVTNTSASVMNLNEKLLYLETYSENKTLLERKKVNLKTLNVNEILSYSVHITSPFYYLVLVEKTTDDYPKVNLIENNGVSTLTCLKDTETLKYTFKSKELASIEHTITNSDIENPNYYQMYSSYQKKVTNYNNLTGITATFNSTLMGFTAIVALDLEKVNLENIDEVYYYPFKEEAKVVKFEMQTYGFVCN